MATNHKTQRYGKRDLVCDRMKLHLRVLDLRGKFYRLITLRPHSKFTFSTNFYHGTWHIISNQLGARLLARLMWGLSYQQSQGTLVLIHGHHIKSTPFGAERSDPILLANSKLASLDPKTLKTLRSRLNSLGPSQITLRWHTFGFDAEQKKRKGICSRDSTVESSEYDWMYRKENQHLWQDERMSRLGGFVCYSAPPKILRNSALSIGQLNPQRHGTDYCYLAESKSWGWPDGEIQVFIDYQERRSAALEAKKKVLIEKKSYPDTESLYLAVAKQRDKILAARRSP